MRVVDHPNGVQTWHFGFEENRVLAAVTTRRGGTSTGSYASLDLGLHVGDDDQRVLANRALVGDALGVVALTVADQQHGSVVRRIDGSNAGAGHGSLDDARARLGAVDGLATDQPDIALAILVADCAPVVVFDPARPAVGVAHVGRRGAELDVVGVLLDRMGDWFGTDAAQVVAGIGPCIGPAHYEIGEPELGATRAALGDDLLRPTRPGHACFDLLGAVRRRLEQAGVPTASVEASGVDTFAAEADLFSDRRQRPCGRFMLVAALRAGG